MVWTLKGGFLVSVRPYAFQAPHQDRETFRMPVSHWRKAQLAPKMTEPHTKTWELKNEQFQAVCLPRREMERIKCFMLSYRRKIRCEVYDSFSSIPVVTPPLAMYRST